jgi:hypothetical protein
METTNEEITVNEYVNEGKQMILKLSNGKTFCLTMSEWDVDSWKLGLISPLELYKKYKDLTFLQREDDLLQRLETQISLLKTRLYANAHLADQGIVIHDIGKELVKLGQQIIERHYWNQRNGN